MSREENKIENKPLIEKPDWMIEELYRKAWQIVKSNKMLWVFGAAIATGASFNLPNLPDSNSGDTNGLQKIFESNPQQGQELTRVLGTATTATDGVISQLFSAAPPYLWIMLGLELFFLVLFAVFISVIYKSWATGALLENIDRCIKGGKAVISEASEKAFKVLKPLLWLEIIPSLILTLASIIGFIILIVGIAIAPSILKVIFILFTIGFVFFLIYAWIMLTASLVWATRQVVMEGKPAKEALRSGYNIAKKKFWAILLLGFVNNMLIAIVLGVPIVILVGIVIGGAIAGFSSEMLGIAIFIIAGLLFLAFIIGMMVVSGILSAFKATVWSLAYGNIKGKYEKR